MSAITMQQIYVRVLCLLVVFCLVFAFCAEAAPIDEEESFQRDARAPKAKFIRFGRAGQKLIRFGRSHGMPVEPSEQYMNYWPSDVAY
ncbi:FMRFamide-related peptide [Aphelenchoides fujianensis]|nr:FMRFamide-related peptide [Aphelenchoides fujianensis]